MSFNTICILGGTGFVGTVLSNQLSQAGYVVRVFTRKIPKFSKLNPSIDVIEVDVHDLNALHQQLQNCDVVINLIGILNERGFAGKGFYKAHVTLVENVLLAAKKNNVKRILHMSALNADAHEGPSFYLRSKGLAEERLFAQSDIPVTCYRPSVIFGEDDSFFNRFASLLKPIPLFFPLACPNARFAPIFVKDVVDFMIETIDDEQTYGQYYDLVGSEEYRLIELVRYTAECLGVKRTVIPLNDTLSKLQASVFDFIPSKPFSTDNYNSCQRDSVSQNNALSRYAITPQKISDIVPHYLAER